MGTLNLHLNLGKCKKKENKKESQFLLFGCEENLRLYLVPRKCKGKHETKKIERKSKRKEKAKENIK